MKTHELKVDKEFFEKVLSGEKNFEIRLGNKTYKEGDTLILLEKDSVTKELTGRKTEKTVTYSRNTKDVKHWSKEEIEKFGLQIIAFK